MGFFRPKTRLDKVFEIGILLKGIDGLFETVGGILLLIIKPDQVNRVVKSFTGDQLSENSHSLISKHLVHWSNSLTRSALIFGGIYLLAHGVAKLVLVVEILRDHLWAYIGLIVLTTSFIVYQTYEFIYTHSIALALLTVFDAIIVYLTVREYKKQRSRLEHHQPMA